MTYAVSDIHGCYGKYKALLEKLDLKEDDRLYVLGDVVDRGPDGPKILLDMMSRKNVTLLLGNHDEAMFIVLQDLRGEDPLLLRDEGALKVLDAWLSDGGAPTLIQYDGELTEDERERVLQYIRDARKYALLEINGRKHLLAHSIPSYGDFILDDGMEGLDQMDFTFNETDYDIDYESDVIMVSGHTPTGLIDPAYAGRILRRNNHIAIDCGAVFGYPLGCICLDTGEEIYEDGGEK